MSNFHFFFSLGFKTCWVGNLSSTALLEIELLDINDNSPEADDVIEREIPRSSEIDYVIVSQINATDRDSGRNALLSFGNKYFLAQ